MAKLIERFIHPHHPRLYLQLRSDSKFLQAVAFIGGRKQQCSTRTTHLPTALRLAEDWYKRPNLLMIARNAGTSVAMIDAFYARRLSAEMGKDLLTQD